LQARSSHLNGEQDWRSMLRRYKEAVYRQAQVEALFVLAVWTLEPSPRGIPLLGKRPTRLLKSQYPAYAET
jgi:hypothetical protein